MHRSLEVPRPHSATLPRRATTPGVFPPPGHVAPSPFLPASTPSSRRDLPGVSTRRAPGVPPSRACSTGDRDASRRPPPLWRLASARFRGRGLASGVSSLRPMGKPRGDLSFALPPGPPGLSPPWGSPLCRPRTVACPTRIRPPEGVRAQSAAGPPHLHFGTVPFPGRFPLLLSIKEP